jgi:hypothetical protein
MFRWFAPLLLFAGKPDVVIRIVTIAIAAAALAFGVWLASNIALTVDALRNPYIAAIYGIVLFCFFVGVGTIAWLRLRRSPAAPRLAAPRAQPEIPLAKEIAARRAEEISAKWERGSARAAPPPQARLAASKKPDAAPQAVKLPARTSLAVTGPSYSGKTALIAVLAQATSANPPETSDIVRLIDAGPADSEERHLADLAARAAASDGVLFVVDQDLRAPEVAAIARLVATGKPLYVVLNKADQFNAADRDAVLLSIRAKMPKKFAPGHVVSVAGAPSPVEREIEDARGAVRVELRRPASDLRALTSLIARAYPPAPGRALRFESDS